MLNNNTLYEIGIAVISLLIGLGIGYFAFSPSKKEVEAAETSEIVK